MKLVANKSSLQGEINIPGSKSHTIRAIAIATMAEGTSVLHEALDSSDTRSAIEAAKAFGAKVTTSNNTITITGIGKNELPDQVLIDVGNSGTTLRIFTALASLSSKAVRFDGDKSIRTRPMTPLFDALKMLGVKIESTDDKCPFTITGPLQGGKTEVNGISSQFLTAVLFSAPLSGFDTEIEVVNLHEKPYVNITLDWLRKQKIQFDHKGLNWFKTKGKQSFKAFDGRIAADFSSATFAACAAVVSKSEILIKGLDFNDHQGDKAIFNYLADMGAEITHTNAGVLVKPGKLKGIEIDMNDTPDALPAMAVVACFAQGTTSLVNVKQARLKECDRIAAMATELTKLGVSVKELPDGLVIEGGTVRGGKVHGYDDHRMVMALGIAGLATEGKIEIDTAEAIAVTYPSFVEDYTKLGANFKIIE